MATTDPTEFEQLARQLDDSVRAIRQGLEASGVIVTDWSNRQPHYDPLRSICYTFVKRISNGGEHQKFTVSLSTIEPAVEGDQVETSVTTKLERFWIGKPSHWQSCHESTLSSAEVTELSLASLVHRQIDEGLAEISQSI